jgi:hypothetical protein
MFLYMLTYAVSPQHYLQLQTTPKDKNRANFEVSAGQAEQSAIPFVCDMASCHRDIMSNRKFYLNIYTL